ncbi:MAG TPA: hypothetical protein DCE18_09540 [Syntrophobacteraceae bacterium]|nr:hypothetical protein [Syntrophobacteraceae bacterium]HBZ54035.1 hypothetical protein [Syntrophobacteraceae bacterium]
MLPTGFLLGWFPPGTAWALESKEEVVLNHAKIEGHQVGAPFGRFLLIRNGSNACAIRFAEFHRGYNAQTPTFFNSGDETHHAEYRWYWQMDGSGNFTNSNTRSGNNKLIQKPLLGIGRFAFQTGRIHVRCGPFTLLWQYPVSLSFDAKGGCSDHGTEMAPTRWKEVTEIDIHDAQLSWYRCDEHRHRLLIPLDAL